jgi:ADP-ribosylglycohydrolase
VGGAGGAPGARDWPRGATSDDTAQLLPVAAYLVEADGQVDERAFLGRLAKALPGMRGPARPSRQRCGAFRQPGELQAAEGSSIGAAMRALPFGWATPVAAVVAAGLREAEQLAQQHALHPATLQPLRRAAGGDRPPTTAEPTLDALATVASVLRVLRGAAGLATAMKHAVALGGDTDTTAAIVGGILGCQLEDVGGQIPWLPSGRHA